MTTENRELLLRSVGIIEGLMLTTEGGLSDALELVVENIDKVLEEVNDGT